MGVILLALAAAGAVYTVFRWRTHTYPDPASFITEPLVDAHLSRTPEGDLHLSWQQDAYDRVTVYAGPAPDKIDRSKSVAEVTSGSRTSITGLAMPSRPFLELVFSDGGEEKERVIVAERTLPLVSAPNFRDLGGYRTTDGHRVRWGRVYRAGLMTYLTETDLAYLAALDIRLICDLRSAEEIAAEPDQVPDGAVYQNMNLVTEHGGTLRRLWAVMVDRRQMGKIMDNAYMQIMIDANTALIGDLFRRLADPDQLPALIHCTAGKDRTGIASALLLLTLGVPEEVVIADYSLSNRYYDHFKKITEKTVAPLTRFGITTEDLRPLLSADPNRLRATFAYIEQRYGSLHNYLRRAAGIDDATLDALKENLLE